MTSFSNVPSIVLIVDDDESVGLVLTGLLAQAGHHAFAVTDGPAALRALEREPADVVITDLRMPGMDGMTLLSQLGAQWPEIPVIMLTAHGAVPQAVEAMRRGAVDFLLKPFERDDVLASVARALKRRPQPKSSPSDGLIGDHPALTEALSLLSRAASSDATVLLRGESGTGKELAVDRLHQESQRGAGPLIKLNCAALPEGLLESELFGYHKGAFTGADLNKPGRVELAEGGTLFLDEIGDVSLSIQLKLLRLLQSRDYTPLGGTQTRVADVRVVAATHRPLEQMIKEGIFREDFFYRLNVISIELPPLRARRSDIEPLAHFFVARLGQRHGRAIQLADDAIAALRSYDWPGNVRELENCIERLVVLSSSTKIGGQEVRKMLNRPLPTAESVGPTFEARVKQAEREALLEALEGAKDNRTVAARLLGISRRTLYNKLNEHGLL